MDINEIVTKQDLLKVKADLVSFIKEELSTIGSSSKKWIKTHELQEMLGLSASGVQNLRVNGTIPYTKLGGIIYYDYSEIQKILESNKSNVQ